MNIVRITAIALPLLVASSSALADSEDKKKQGTAEPQTPAEEQKAEAPAMPPTPPPAATTLPVGTTQTTAAYQTKDIGEPKVEAHQGSPVGNRLSMEPLIGAGTNDFNFGIGGRFGYTFPVPVYLGATFMWYHGDTNNFVTQNSFVEARSSFYYPGIEAGYDIGIGRKGSVMVRPYAGAGILFNRDRVSTNNVAVTDTTDEVVLYPGLTARYTLPKSPVYVGLDTRLLIPVVHTNLSYQGFFVTGLSL